MSERDHGGPAFPVENVNTPRGMTMRDYFAAKVLQEIVTDPSWDKEVCSIASKNGGSTEIIRAHLAYRHADAMLAERES